MDVSEWANYQFILITLLYFPKRFLAMIKLYWLTGHKSQMCCKLQLKTLNNRKTTASLWNHQKHSKNTTSFNVSSTLFLPPLSSFHAHLYIQCQKVRKWGVGFLTVNKIRFKHFVLLLCVYVHNWSVSQWKQYELQIWNSWRNIIFWKWKAPQNLNPANGGSDFWLSVKSISNTLSCCCFVCTFIIGQYHSGNNMSSKSGTAGEILIFESEKRHKIPTLKTDMLTVSTFNAFMHVHDESKHYLSHWFAQRR